MEQKERKLILLVRRVSDWAELKAVWVRTKIGGLRRHERAAVREISAKGNRLVNIRSFSPSLFLTVNGSAQVKWTIWLQDFCDFHKLFCVLTSRSL